MDLKQSFAKIGVFALLGVNVGAYYYFWPRHGEETKVAARAAVQDNGETQILPPKASASVPAAPEQLPPERATTMDAAPGGIFPLSPLLTPETGQEHRKVPLATVLKLIELIDNDKAPDSPTLPPAESTKREERAKIEFAPAIPRPDVDVAVAPPLTPKTPPVLWQVQTAEIGNRTQLTARLRDAATDRVLVEFRILCDRAETNAQSGTVQALGNVTFSGAGWRGACQCVTLPAHETRAVFEQQVEIAQDILGTSQDGILRGERIVWSPPGPATVGVSSVTLPISR